MQKETYDLKRLGSTIKKMRILNFRKTQRELSSVTKVPQRVIAQIENGKVSVGRSEVKRLASFFNLDLDRYILKGKRGVVCEAKKETVSIVEKV